MASGGKNKKYLVLHARFHVRILLMTLTLTQMLSLIFGTLLTAPHLVNKLKYLSGLMASHRRLDLRADHGKPFGVLRLGFFD